MRVWIGAALMLCACGDDGAHVDAMTADAMPDATIDANEGQGVRVEGIATGVRDPMKLVFHAAGVDDQVVELTTDGAFVFPYRVPDATSYTITPVGSQACLPASGTITATGAKPTIVCDGVIDLSAVAFTVPGGNVFVRLKPRFDPRIETYGQGDEPLLLDDATPITVVPTKLVADAIMTIAASPTVADTTLQIDVSHPAWSTARHYLFPLHRALAQEAYAKPAVGAGGLHAGGTLTTSAGYFGATGVAVAGETVVVGAPDTTGARVTIYRRIGRTWTIEQTLTPPVGGSRFGASVATDGTTLAIGAPADGAGAVYVYRYTGTSWAPQDVLRPASLTGLALFGASVAISGPYIAAGAPGQGTTGAAFVFKNTSTWTIDATLTPAATGGQFGSAVAISGLSLVVGAPLEGAGAGAVYMYASATWAPAGAAAVGAANSRLGAAVGISGDLVAAGAPNETVATKSAAGTVHVYRFAASLSPEATLQAATPTTNETFGFAVGVDSGHIIVGAPAFGSITGLAGSCYVFKKPAATWLAQPQVQAANAGAGDQFGASVAVNFHTFVVGAPKEDSGASGINSTDTGDVQAVWDAGAAYVFR